MTFTIELAGIPIQVSCRYAENRDFFRDYRTDRPPLLTAAPSEEDLRRVRRDLDRNARREDFPPSLWNGRWLENSALHGLLAEALTAHGVLLMHGSALVMDGAAVIFTAPSGTGKSTHARLWREAFGDRVWMLNDDKPLLRIGPEGVTAYGSPWDGKHRLSRNASAPLKAVAALERGADNRIAPMSRADAFPLLLRQALVSEKPEAMARILALDKALLDAVPFYRLRCNMDPDAARTARDGIFGA